MRLKLFILVFSFANLLVTPTLILLQDSGDGISVLLNLNEEESSEEEAFFSDYLSSESTKSVMSSAIRYTKSNLYYTSSFKTVYQRIVLPPPDFRIEV